MTTYYGGDGPDSLSSAAYDAFYGGDGKDYFFSTKTGLNYTEGGRGDDYLGVSWIVTGTYLNAYGGDGNDWIQGGNSTSIDHLYGGEGNDYIQGGDPDSAVLGNEYIEGGAGIDALYGYAGDDALYGGDGDDTNIYTITVYGTQVVTAGLYGGDGNDYLDGGRGNDYLDGGAGNDSLFGGDGVDKLIGGTGADLMAGGNGGDVYEVDNTGDMVWETPDTVAGTYDTVFAYVDYTLSPNVENLVMIYGTQVYGYGSAGDNNIMGNASNNVLEGRAGYDVITGGAGSDYFVENPGFGVDVITDFTAGMGTPDALAFSKALFQTVDQVLAAAKQVGADTWITDALGDTVVLQNVKMTTLASDDFLFI